MQKYIQKFREHVIERSKNPNFVHYKWFVKYHLEIVEQIALELCGVYKKADRDLVTLLVWLHDYGKILDFSNQYTATIPSGRRTLSTMKFSSQFMEKALLYAGLIDKYDDMDMHAMPIEVQIVSSSDGAAHFVGPFFSLWWYENSNRPIEDLMRDNEKKAFTDWNNKIVLPEIKDTFQERYSVLQEQIKQVSNEDSFPNEAGQMNELREEIIRMSKSPNFIHHKWFVKYYIKIFERIALSMCDEYTNADKNLVSMLVWIHDYGKILGMKNTMQGNVIEGEKKLSSIGFSQEQIRKTLVYTEALDKKEEVVKEDAPIEMKIVSSADGAAHLVSPFFMLWFYENPDRSIEDLMEGNRKKALHDWNDKVVLFNVKRSFQRVHDIVMEQNGQLPEKFLR